MRILQINKFLFQFGGAERYMFELSRLLQQNGHEVSFFGMQHPRNVDSEDAQYFVSRVDYRRTSAAYRLRTFPRTLGKTVYSFESRRRLRKMLRARKPDLAHVHLISHHISPSILDELKSHRIPIVHTVHEYKLVCPSYHLYLHDTAQICERCLGGNYFHAIAQRCVHGSLAGSTLAAAAQYLHRGLGIYEKNVDLFMSPSQFMADKLVSGGVVAEKIRVLKLWIDPDAYEPQYRPGGYVIYFGRLSPEKGVGTLLAAMSRLRHLRLVVVGDGPDREPIEQVIRSKRLTNVECTGFRDGTPLRELVRNAAFAVVPSLWYENSPLVVYEANALGKPVVASRIGGLPEDIEDGKTGYLFEPGNVDELAHRVQSLAADRGKCEEMGRCAHARLRRTCQGHYHALMDLYDEAMSRP